MIFNDKKTRDYIAPKGMMLLYWTPLKPLSENIPTIRGVEGSTNIYSDIKPGPDGGTSTGLLTCCTKYKATLGGSEMGFKFCLDIFGTDLSSVRKHLIRHLNDIQRTSENTVGLETYLPEGMEWSDVILIFIELGIDLKDADIENTYALEWWRKSMF